MISTALEVIELRTHKAVQDEFTFDENYFKDSDEPSEVDKTGIIYFLIVALRCDRLFRGDKWNFFRRTGL
jgi:hypothetical protein